MLRLQVLLRRHYPTNQGEHTPTQPTHTIRPASPLSPGIGSDSAREGRGPSQPQAFAGLAGLDSTGCVFWRLDPPSWVSVLLLASP